MSADKKLTEMRRREATRKKRPTVMYGAQKKRFSEQVGDGAERAPVFARARGEEEWLEVGQISVAKGAETTVADAARYQKRIILGHATRVHRHLQMQSEVLECGLGEPTSAGAADAADAADADTAPASNILLIERGVGTDDDSMPFAASFAMAATCGFSGAPIPDAGHYYSNSATDDVARDARKVNLQNQMGNAAKSEVAVQASKTLGLRSLG